LTRTLSPSHAAHATFVADTKAKTKASSGNATKFGLVIGAQVPHSARVGGEKKRSIKVSLGGVSQVADAALAIRSSIRNPDSKAMTPSKFTKLDDRVAEIIRIGSQLQLPPEPPEVTSLRRLLGGIRDEDVPEETKREFVDRVNAILRVHNYRLRIGKHGIGLLFYSKPPGRRGYVQYSLSSRGAMSRLGRETLDVVRVPEGTRAKRTSIDASVSNP
jgi:hypothetical protein